MRCNKCINQICFTKGYDVSNICYGESVSISEVVYNIFDILKKSKNKIFFDKDKPTTIPIRRLSNNKAKRELDFIPKYPIHRGLKKTIKWYIKNYV